MEYAVFILGLLSVPIVIITTVIYFRTKESKYIKAVIVLTIFVITVFIRLSYTEFWLVDPCLYSGGSYNYSQETCVH